MGTIPVALWVILIVVAGCGGYLFGRAGRHQCVICYRPLPRVCTDARCGDTPRRSDQSAERIEHRVTGDGERGERDEATELLIVRAALRQHIVDGRTLAPVYVELEAYDRPEDEHAGMVLTPLQGRLLAAGIRMLLRTAVG